MRLGIVIHGHRPDAMAAAHHVVAQLASCGAQVLVEDEVLAAFASGSVTSLNAPDARADVILSLGGDGTLLRGAQYALSWDAALLGVNLGRVGFLAEGEADALPKLLDKVIRGDYETERRAVLQADVREAAGRRADVHAHLAAQVRLKGRNCLFQLQSAAAGIGVRLAADFQLVLRLNQLRRLVDAARADVHLARHDADLRLRAAFAKPAFHQRHISPLLFAH